MELERWLGCLTWTSTRLKGVSGACSSANHTGYRLQLAQRYPYILPETRLLDVIARYSPLVEVGAGTGYWSYLLRQRGADIIAYDQAPLGGERSNRYHYELWPWTEVLEGDATVLQHHPDRSLLICWPPSSPRWAKCCVSLRANVSSMSALIGFNSQEAGYERSSWEPGSCAVPRPRRGEPS
jgi:hypothetical protein